LLACDAWVTLRDRAGASKLPLSLFVSRRADLLAAPALVVEVRIPWPTSPHGGALAAVARTPADAPIVVAAATVRRDGARCDVARLALGGVADAPLDLSEMAVVLAGQPWSDTAITDLVARVAAGLQPIGDFRGSAAYRRAMAETLGVRALRTAWARAA
jgi:CO/xanthine dehydrogenase FAD-binding subunit